MRKIPISTIIVSFLFCSIAFGQTPVSMNGKLKLVGNQLSSECGNAVQLRGMSSHGLQWYGNCVNNSAFTSLKNDWKADVVRLAMYVDEGGYKSDPTGYKTKIDAWVDQIGALGMYALIDFHILNPGDPNTNLTTAKEFWGYMSNKHKGKKYVLYEICNEPNGVAWSVIKTYAEAVIPIIRANDPETIIIVGTPQWSGKPGDVVSGGPLTSTNAYNTMYTFHFYAASHASYRAEVQKAAKSIPIFSTEWGLSESSGGGNISIAEGQLWMDIFNGNNDGQQKISWCNWSFSDKGESSAALNPGACGSSAWTNTTASGTQVKTWINSPVKSFTDCGATGNKNPIVSLTSPANNSSVCAGTANSITATASDPDGTISKVEFYNGTTLLGTVTTSPYTYSWTPNASASASITAKAYDNAATAGTATSTAVSVTITAPLIAPTGTNPVIFCENSTAPVWNAAALSGNTLQWYTVATGGTGTSAIPIISNTPSGIKNVWVSQKSSNGCESPRLALTTNVIPLPTTPSASNPVDFCENSTAVVWSATASSGNTLQWYTAATGGTASGTAPTISNTPAGIRSVYVSQKTINLGCEGPRLLLTTNVTPKTVITKQPKDTTICPGNSLNLIVSATGTGTLSYQWKQNGNNVGSNSRIFTKAFVAGNDAGSYTVDVKNSCGTVTSNVAVVSISTSETPNVTLTSSKSQLCGDGTSCVVLTANPTEGGSAQQYTFKTGTTTIGTTNQTSNTLTYCIPANPSTSVQNLFFTVDLKSNSSCITQGANNPITSSPVSLQVDPQVTSAIANIIESKATICVGTRNLTASTLPASYTANWSTVGGGASIFTAGLISGIGVGQSTLTTYKVESPLKLCPSKTDTVTTRREGQLTNPDAVVALNNKNICSIVTAPKLTGLTSLQAGETGTWSVPAGATNTVTASGQTGNLQTGANKFIYTIISSIAVSPCNIDTALVTINVAPIPSKPVITNSVGACNTKRTGIGYLVTNNAGSTFNWSVTGGVVASGQGTNNVLIDFNSGVTNATVSVIETNAQKCASATASLNVMIDICTGFEDNMINSSNLKLYPNPFEDHFTIDLGKFYSQVEKIELCNLEGKVMEVKQGSEIVSEIELGKNVANGQYFARIATHNSVIVKSLVKIK